ncbi:DUF2789 domain-containing protein [Denitratisoma sp. agr-D3]
MQRPIITMGNLFAQLGRAGDEEAIDRFIHEHSPMPSALRLDEAAFWSPSQSAFLSEAILEDSDWADIVEILNTKLHTGKSIEYRGSRLTINSPSYRRQLAKH